MAGAERKKNSLFFLKSKKGIIFFAIIAILLFFEVIWFYGAQIKGIASHFHKNSGSVSGIILFYGNNCVQCTRVDSFIKDNNIESKIVFTKLEVLQNPVNANIMEDRAQVCGLDPAQIGVPFLWDGKNCFIGYVDVIKFFQGKIHSVK